MHRKASQGTVGEIPGACPSTRECWWRLTDFLPLFLFQLLMEELSRKKSTLFHLSLKKNNSTNQLKIEKAAQNWKGSSRGAIPAGNTLTPGQGKSGSCADRRSGIRSSDTLQPSQNKSRTWQAQHCPFSLSSAWWYLKDSQWTTLFLSLITARQILLPKIPDYTITATSVLLNEDLVTKPRSLLELV